MNQYLSIAVKQRMALKKSYVDQKLKDFNVIAPMTIIGLLARPLPAILPLAGYLYFDERFKASLDKHCEAIESQTDESEALLANSVDL